MDEITISQYTAILLSGAFTVLGALIGSLITHRLTIKRIDRERSRSIFNEAAEEFRSAFDETMFELEKGKESTCLLLETFFNVQRFAYIRFKRHFAGDDLGRLEEDWKQYEDFFTNYRFLNLCSGDINDDVEFELSKKKRCYSHINKLLNHAKLK